MNAIDRAPTAPWYVTYSIKVSSCPVYPISWPFPTIPLPAEKLASPVVSSG